MLLGGALLAVGQQVAGGGQRHPGAHVSERLAQPPLVARPAAPGEDHLAVAQRGPQIHDLDGVRRPGKRADPARGVLRCPVREDPRRPRGQPVARRAVGVRLEQGPSGDVVRRPAGRIDVAGAEVDDREIGPAAVSVGMRDRRDHEDGVGDLVEQPEVVVVGHRHFSPPTSRYWT